MLKKAVRNSQDEKEGPAAPKGHDPLNEKGQFKNIYISIQSKMGCLARITVTRKALPGEQTTQTLSKDSPLSTRRVLTLNMKERVKKMSPGEIDDELTSFLEDNK